VSRAFEGSEKRSELLPLLFCALSRILIEISHFTEPISYFILFLFFTLKVWILKKEKEKERERERERLNNVPVYVISPFYITLKLHTFISLFSYEELYRFHYKQIIFLFFLFQTI
jgi:hypothetical protein